MEVGSVAIIFCRVIDHFGDAGFCWRLSLALVGQGVRQMILVADRPQVVRALHGEGAPQHVTVLDWDRALDEWSAGGIPPSYRSALVIEAFACSVPDEFAKSLSPTARWITLDHLATEPWADQVHAMSSPHPRVQSAAAAKRQWVIPGFSARTGGLLHGSWRHLGGKERDRWRARLAGRSIGRTTFLVLAFGYSDAQWPMLEASMRRVLPRGFVDAVVWRPEGLDYPQEEFDQILQACDLNFVRGEDSFVRAHWAAAGRWQVPFVWQPYRQPQHGHDRKLAGWTNQILDRAALALLSDLHWAWNQLASDGVSNPPDFDRAWDAFCRRYATVKQALSQKCEGLALQPSLEERLMTLIS